MFCALNGATRTPSRCNSRHNPAVIRLFPTSDPVPKTAIDLAQDMLKLVSSQALNRKRPQSQDNRYSRLQANPLSGGKIVWYIDFSRKLEPQKWRNYEYTPTVLSRFSEMCRNSPQLVPALVVNGPSRGHIEIPYGHIS